MAELKWFTYNGMRLQLPVLGAGEAPSPEWVGEIEFLIGSDGCSGVPEFYHECCVVHDLAYRFQVDPWGQAVTQQDADRNFRACIQERSKWGKWSPMSWWRWATLRLVGKKAWDGHRRLLGGPWSGPEPKAKAALLLKKKRRHRAS